MFPDNTFRIPDDADATWKLVRAGLVGRSDEQDSILEEFVFAVGEKRLSPQAYIDQWNTAINRSGVNEEIKGVVRWKFRVVTEAILKNDDAQLVIALWLDLMNSGKLQQ